MMRFEASIKKQKRFWIARCDALDIITQGHTKAEAAKMLEDAVETLIGRRGFKATLSQERSGASLSANDEDMLVALLLRRLRQKNGLTLREVAKRLGSPSINAFARYEQGRARPSIAKFSELLHAVAPDIVPILKLAA